MIFVIGFYFNTLHLTQTANKSEQKKHKTDEEILIDFFFLKWPLSFYCHIV